MIKKMICSLIMALFILSDSYGIETIESLLKRSFPEIQSSGSCLQVDAFRIPPLTLWSALKGEYNRNLRIRRILDPSGRFPSAYDIGVNGEKKFLATTIQDIKTLSDPKLIARILLHLTSNLTLQDDFTDVMTKEILNHLLAQRDTGIIEDLLEYERLLTNSKSRPWSGSGSEGVLIALALIEKRGKITDTEFKLLAQMDRDFQALHHLSTHIDRSVIARLISSDLLASIKRIAMIRGFSIEKESYLLSSPARLFAETDYYLEKAWWQINENSDYALKSEATDIKVGDIKTMFKVAYAIHYAQSFRGNLKNEKPFLDACRRLSVAFTALLIRSLDNVDGESMNQLLFLARSIRSFRKDTATAFLSHDHAVSDMVSMLETRFSKDTSGHRIELNEVDSTGVAVMSYFVPDLKRFFSATTQSQLMSFLNDGV